MPQQLSPPVLSHNHGPFLATGTKDKRFPKKGSAPYMSSLVANSGHMSVNGQGVGGGRAVVSPRSEKISNSLDGNVSLPVIGSVPKTLLFVILLVLLVLAYMKRAEIKARLGMY